MFRTAKNRKKSSRECQLSSPGPAGSPSASARNERIRTHLESNSTGRQRWNGIGERQEHAVSGRMRLLLASLETVETSTPGIYFETQAKGPISQDAGEMAASREMRKEDPK